MNGNRMSDEWDLPISKHKLAREMIAMAASRGGFTLDAVACIMGVTKQRIDQIERSALVKVAAKAASLGLLGWSIFWTLNVWGEQTLCMVS